MAKTKKSTRAYMAPDLESIARRAMLEKGLIVDFPAAALRQAKDCRDLGTVTEKAERVTDLRALPWTSIDNDDSQDLDQLEVVFMEGEEYRLLVAVADVESFVSVHSPIDAAAKANTTSVYTGVKNFPMLPERLSFDLTSLLQGKSRRAMVTEMRIGPDGHIAGSRIFPALVQNQAKLCYDAIADWLEGKATIPEPLAQNKDLRHQVHVQDRLARTLRRKRMAAGALEFDTLDTRIEMAANGRVKRISSRRQNRAERIIEELMVACNGATAAFLAARGLPVFSRVVREPERWPRIVELAAGYHSRLPGEPDAKALSGFLRKARQAKPDAFTDLSLAVIKLIGRGEYHVLPGGRIPEGHFGLALNHYAHSTAPNRRYPDLVTQRLLKAALSGRQKNVYSLAALQALAGHCTQQEDAANKVERQVKKCAAAELLEDKVGMIFSALVTGSSDKGTWVRIKNPPVEGKLVRGSRPANVGDRLRVRLVATNVEKGFIDFARV
ncbi:MAG TPA: RNB domain-containing ribonuclease [Candidatus Binatia bacterium]|nr:RNB domain-containing ribonuclease [Candidatus Binatia bacterium]